MALKRDAIWSHRDGTSGHSEARLRSTSHTRLWSIQWDFANDLMQSIALPTPGIGERYRDRTSCVLDITTHFAQPLQHAMYREFDGQSISPPRRRLKRPWRGIPTLLQPPSPDSRLLPRPHLTNQRRCFETASRQKHFVPVMEM